MKRFFNFILILLIVSGLCGCGKSSAQPETQLLKVGFSQLGSESDWRAANTESMISALSEENGFELLYDNAKQKQENQLLAIRNFILQNVDIIILAPDSETGWDNVLQEAKNADIPVFIVDRDVVVEDPDLYLCGIGSDFYQEGQTAVSWLENELSRQGREKEVIHIVNLKGTSGASAEIGRTKAIQQAASLHKNWFISAEFNGEFTEAKGYEVVRDYLKSDPDIDVIYSQNDNMTFGAMRALDEAGISYGEGGDVILISFDAVREALNYCMDGKINLCVECSPLHGPRVLELIDQYRAGESIPKKIYVQESYFTPDSLTQEIIDSRLY